MSQAHIHLLFTHLPIFGSMFGALVMAHGLGTKSDQTRIAAYNILILCGLGAGISYYTGEAAEHLVKGIDGVTKANIHAHEHFALYALIAMIISGVVSCLGIVLTVRQSPHSRTMARVTLFIALISFGISAQTGYLGGQIRHTEIATEGQSPALPANDDDKD